jgi:hypothetical protein
LAEIKDDDYDQLKDFMIKDQYLHICSPELALFLKERPTNDLDKIADMAERFLDARKFTRPVKNDTPIGGHMTQKAENAPRFRERHQNYDSNVNFTRSQNSRPSRDPVRCWVCDKVGHVAKDCVQRAKMNAMFELEDEPKEVALNCAYELPGKSNIGQLQSRCKPGALRIETGRVNNKPVTVLRDSGCTSIIIRKRLVKPNQLVQTFVSCRLIDGTVKRFQLAIIDIETSYVSGLVKAICIDNPICDLIIGNVDSCDVPLDRPSEWGFKNAFAQTTEAIQTVSTQTAVSSRETETEINTLGAVITRSQAAKETRVPKPLHVPSIVDFGINAAEFKVKQKEDSELAVFWQKARESHGSDLENNQSEFVIKDDVLYRRYKNKFGYTVLQLILPLKFRQQILTMAHDNIMAGHLGIKKTYEKISAHFFWPGIGRSVKDWCRSCDQCQRTMPKGRNPKAELGRMPIIDVPFKRVAIDIIGKISPMSESKNQYILTLIDFATRYPEAVPLKSIDTVTVAEALFGIFSRIGIPEEVLSDNGSQLVSQVMEEVMRMLSVKHLVTTVYHPECNGLCENYNGTLKRMLKKVCMEKPRDWDRYIPALLFAYRDTPQESLGFSPFMLVYGRDVRGPLKIAKDLLVKVESDEEVKTTYEYVVDLKNRLKETCELAHAELRKNQIKQKTYYDRKAVKRNFKPGDFVLLLLPTDHNKLLMHWKGPFELVRKQSEHDYIIKLGGNKEKVFHINMLKPYFSRAKIGEEENDFTSRTEAIASVIELDEGEMETENLPETINLIQTETYENVDLNPNLPEDKQRELRQLVYEFRDIFTDVPKVTNLGEHKITLTSSIPVKQRPYPIPYALREAVDEEIDSMLRNRIIEPCESAYASPLVIVKKPDGSLRLCCDYKKLNSITVFDPEPMPIADDIFAKLANSKYFSKFDMSKGYWQVPMAREHRDYTAFVCHRGLFRFNMMPFGLVNSAACYTRIMRKLTCDLNNTNNYIDDVICDSDDWKYHLIVLRNFFETVRSGNLSLRPKKCSLGYDSVSFLGYTVKENFLLPKQDNIKAIREAEPPKTKKQLRGLIGMLSFYRRFVPHFAEIILPLTELTKKRGPNNIEWGEQQQRAFETVKSLLCSAPILKLPDPNKEYILQTDASGGGLGATLLQEFEGVLHPVMYASRKLLDRETRYSVIERECLAIVWAFQKYHNYLYGKEFVLQTDHQPLSYLNSARYRNTRIMRWNLLLQPYKFSVSYLKGTNNLFSDFLSRL